MKQMCKNDVLLPIFYKEVEKLPSSCTIRHSIKMKSDGAKPRSLEVDFGARRLHAGSKDNKMRSVIANGRNWKKMWKWSPGGLNLAWVILSRGIQTFRAKSDYLPGCSSARFWFKTQWAEQA